MSPEQACGDKSIDARTDQYSLAVVGYRMLAGKLPFEGESTRAVLYQQLVAEPPPIAATVPGVPSALASAIQRAMSKEPTERFANMTEFAAMLDAEGLGTGKSACDCQAGIEAAARRRNGDWLRSRRRRAGRGSLDRDPIAGHAGRATATAAGGQAPARGHCHRRHRRRPPPRLRRWCRRRTGAKTTNPKTPNSTTNPTTTACETGHSRRRAQRAAHLASNDHRQLRQAGGRRQLGGRRCRPAPRKPRAATR